MRETTRDTNTRPWSPVRSMLPPCVSAALALLAYGGSLPPALADEPAVNTGLMQLAQDIVTPVPLPNAVIAPPSPPPGQNPYALADSFKIRGWTIPLPSASDTID